MRLGWPAARIRHIAASREYALETGSGSTPPRCCATWVLLLGLFGQGDRLAESPVALPTAERRETGPRTLSASSPTSITIISSTSSVVLVLILWTGSSLRISGRAPIRQVPLAAGPKQPRCQPDFVARNPGGKLEAL